MSTTTPLGLPLAVLVVVVLVFLLVMLPQQLLQQVTYGGIVLPVECSYIISMQIALSGSMRPPISQDLMDLMYSQDPMLLETPWRVLYGITPRRVNSAFILPINGK
jgi:hypothetical protein